MKSALSLYSTSDQSDIIYNVPDNLSSIRDSNGQTPYPKAIPWKPRAET